MGDKEPRKSEELNSKGNLNLRITVEKVVVVLTIVLVLVVVVLVVLVVLVVVVRVVLVVVVVVVVLVVLEIALEVEEAVVVVSVDDTPPLKVIPIDARIIEMTFRIHHIHYRRKSSEDELTGIGD